MVASKRTLSKAIIKHVCQYSWLYIWLSIFRISNTNRFVLWGSKILLKTQQKEKQPKNCYGNLQINPLHNFTYNIVTILLISKKIFKDMYLSLMEDEKCHQCDIISLHSDRKFNTENFILFKEK